MVDGGNNRGPKPLCFPKGPVCQGAALDWRVPSLRTLLLFVPFNYAHRAKRSTQLIDAHFSPRREKVIYLQELYIFFQALYGDTLTPLGC